MNVVIQLRVRGLFLLLHNSFSYSREIFVQSDRIIVIDEIPMVFRVRPARERVVGAIPRAAREAYLASTKSAFSLAKTGDGVAEPKRKPRQPPRPNLREGYRAWDVQDEDYASKFKFVKYSREDREKVKDAIAAYSREMDADHEEVLRCIFSGEIRKTKNLRDAYTRIAFLSGLEHRSVKSIMKVAVQIAAEISETGVGDGGKWSTEQRQTLIDLVTEHGADWKAIGGAMGMHPERVKRKWRDIFNQHEKQKASVVCVSSVLII